MLFAAAGLAVLSVTFGAIGDETDTIVATSAQMDEVLARLGAQTTADAWFATASGWTGPLVGAYAVHALLLLRREEACGILEPVLALATSRARWVLGHVAGVLVASSALLVLVGALR